MTPDNQFENGSTAEQHDKPTAYRVEDDDNLEEKDLRRSYLFGKGDEEKGGDEPNMEAEGQGGHRFGEDNITPSGNDRNNPSQNAGNSNAYLAKTEPSDESSTTNFKDPNQLGQPNYSEANSAASTGQSDEENTAPVKEGSGDSEANPQHPSETEGATQDDDNSVAGYGELPEQQKVGGESGNTSKPGVADYRPEYDEGKPDYGSNSPENRS